VKGFFRETFHTIRLNLLRLAAFSICWRLAAGLGLWKLTGLLLRFSLRSAGYSYLTMSNLFPALVNPAAVLSAILLVVLLAAAMTVELAALITIYQAASYSRKAGLGAIAAGAFSKTWEQMGRRNWRLFLLALASYLMMNCYVLLRVFTRIRPINFVMEELLNIAAGRLFLVLLVAGLALVGVPTMMVFFTCMVEQKNFRDGLRRSRSLIKGKWPGAVLRLFALNGIVLLGMAVLHVVLYLGAAAVAALFEEGYRATAVLLAVSGRIEAVVLFLGSTIATAVDFGGLTVMYGRFAGKDAVRSTAVPASGPVLGLSERGRRRGLAILAAGVALSGLLTADLIWNGSGLEAALLADTEITAHRGSSRRAPENTLPALEAAIEEMADFCEIDVQTTSDGVIVVCHDLNVKRVSGVNRRLGKMTWDEVQKLDVGSFMGQEFAGVGIPALEEMLEAARGRIRLNIELKNIGDETDLPERTAAMILDCGMQEQCVITSVKLSYLERVKNVSQDLKTGYILPAAYGNYYDNPALDFISIRSSFVTPRLVERLHERGKGVHVWTVNQSSEMEQMHLMGVDNIITDAPARAREVIYGEDTAAGLMEYLRLVLR